MGKAVASAAGKVLWLCVVAGMGCAGGYHPPPRVGPELEIVAETVRQWTGVAVSREGRIFVSFPRWSDDVPVSVAELFGGGEMRPYPSKEWNAWDGVRGPHAHFICVQAVVVDNQNVLWILDAANPGFQGVVPQGPKLVKVDLAEDRVAETISFPQDVVQPGSYLNDVRIDTERKIAYISDSGLGAIIVTDLASGKSRRVLGQHLSTKSETTALTVEGREWRLADGSMPRVHVDGIALDPAGEYLYYQALTGRHLYRIETEVLLKSHLPWTMLPRHVELLGKTGAADGIAFGPDGLLYVTAVEDNAVKRRTANDAMETVVVDPRLRWPDSIAFGPDGFLYVTTSQIHLGGNVTDPYRIFRFYPPPAGGTGIR